MRDATLRGSRIMVAALVALSACGPGDPGDAGPGDGALDVRVTDAMDVHIDARPDADAGAADVASDGALDVARVEAGTDASDAADANDATNDTANDAISDAVADGSDAAADAGDAGPMIVVRSVPLASVTRPGEIAYDRRGSWYLIDDTAQDHLTGYGIHVWGTEVRPDGERVTYSVPRYNNDAPSPRAVGGAGWVQDSFVTLTPGQLAPDGTMGATRAQVPAGYDSPFVSPRNASYVSVWERDGTGGVSQNQLIVGNGSVPVVVDLDGTFRRYEYFDRTNATQYFIPSSGKNYSTLGGLPAEPHDVVVDFSMMVAGLPYRLPFTDASRGTPLGPSRTRIMGESVVDARGYFDVTIDRWWAIEPVSTVTHDEVLFSLTDPVTGALYELRLLMATHAFQLTVGGEIIGTSAPQTYDPPLDGTPLHPIHLWHQPDGCGATLGGVNVAITGAPRAPLHGVPEWVAIGSDGLGASQTVFPSQLGGELSATLDGALPCTPKVFADGDGITMGTVGGPPWPDSLAPLLGAPTRARIQNAGYVAGTWTKGVLQFTDDIGIDVITCRPHNIVIAVYGLDDLAGGFADHTPQDTYDTMKQYVAEAHAAGIDSVGVATLISGAGTGTGPNAGRDYDTDLRQEYNALLHAGAGVDFDFLVDFAADPRIGAVGTWMDRTYFTDSRHPNTDGGAIMAQIAYDALRQHFGL